jgi:hypothetical protein
MSSRPGRRGELGDNLQALFIAVRLRGRPSGHRPPRAADLIGPVHGESNLPATPGSARALPQDFGGLARDPELGGQRNRGKAARTYRRRALVVRGEERADEFEESIGLLEVRGVTGAVEEFPRGVGKAVDERAYDGWRGLVVLA